MPRRRAKSARCPTCRKIVLAGEADFPFCSDRCRVIDLGKWASEGYVISTPVNDPESGGEAEYTERPSSSTIKRHSDRNQPGHSSKPEAGRDGEPADEEEPRHPYEDRKPN
jgi:endogenous inhibitor of DNA gyrase (YacG/DUF329 family)